MFSQLAHKDEAQYGVKKYYIAFYALLQLSAS